MKQAGAARVVVGIIFLGLLATPIVIRQISKRHEAVAKTTLDASASIARHGFHLEEVAGAAGIHFVHQAPELDAKLATIMPQVASMGASVSIVSTSTLV